MFLIIADGHDDPLELTSRRDRFQATTFAVSIAVDAREGSVTLQPRERLLRVSARPGDYERIRVFKLQDGSPVGKLTASSDGRVRWMATDLPATTTNRAFS